MKVTGENPSVGLEAYVKNINDKKNIDPSAGQNPKTVSRQDSVVLSPKAKEIQETKELLSAVPDVREEKVAQIKTQIENGTYEIDGEKVASRMIRESLLNEKA